MNERFGLKVARVWVWRDETDGGRLHCTSGVRPEHAVEYIRVLSRQEVDKLATDGIDTQQYINSLLRTIEGQRREIHRLMGFMPEHDTRESYRCGECGAFHLRVPAPTVEITTHSDVPDRRFLAGAVIETEYGCTGCRSSPCVCHEMGNPR